MKLAIVLAAVMLAACNEPPCECQCYPEQQKRLGQIMQSWRATAATPEEARKVIVCKPGEDCVVKVRVTTDGSGQCQAELPYCVVCFRKGEGKSDNEPKVIWELTDADGNATTKYEFHELKGVDIFYGGMTGKNDFHSPGLSGSARSFKWVAGTARSDRLAHAAVVYPVGSDKPCKQIDPDLVNTN